MHDEAQQPLPDAFEVMKLAGNHAKWNNAERLKAVLVIVEDWLDAGKVTRGEFQGKLWEMADPAENYVKLP